jgi:endonuclease/exonuclease/phosphatase family metal-dependent hydrolase
VIPRLAVVLCILAASFSLLSAENHLPAKQVPVQLRVLTLNMYGLRYPPRLGWMADRSDCVGRYRAVAEHIRTADPPYDIVAIQELYRTSDLHIVTCDPAPFLEALGQTGNSHSQPHVILFSPKGENWRGEADGGMGIITPHIIKESETMRFAGAGGTFLAARGVVYARLALPDSHMEVDAYIVHLSPGIMNSQQRKHELETLSKLIAAKSSTSGNPVIVLGDFNIAGPPHAGEEYATMQDVLGHPRDLWLESGYADAGYTYDCSSNAVAQLRGCDYQVRIDYAWVITDPRLSNSEYDVRLNKEKHIRRVEWHTDSAKPLPVSDHYGVEAYLWIGRKDSGNTSLTVVKIGTNKKPSQKTAAHHWQSDPDQKD